MQIIIKRYILVDKIFLYIYAFLYIFEKLFRKRKVKKYILIRIERLIEFFSFFQTTAVAFRSLFDLKLI